MLLLLIGKVIEKLMNTKYFNKLDLFQRYNNVHIKEGNEQKVAFLTNKRLFKPKLIYFGLCNLSEMFQRMMNSIFQKLLHKGVLANYMNDFIILAKTKKKLEKKIIQFLKVVKKHNLYFKQSKCNFDIEEISILGVVVGREEVQMENNKVMIVKEWKTSTKIKEVESFSEFTNFYRCFIKTFKKLKNKINSQLVFTLSRREEKF